MYLLKWPCRVSSMVQEKRLSIIYPEIFIAQKASMCLDPISLGIQGYKKCCKMFLLKSCKLFICHIWKIHAMGKKIFGGRISYKWISKYVSLGIFCMETTKLCREVDRNRNYIF